MEMNFARDGRLLQIDDAHIIFKNFTGEPTQYNREGDRNFAVVIPTEEMKDALVAEGWNVTVKEPKDPGDGPFMYLKVKVKFNDRGPKVYLKSGERARKLSERNVSLIDSIDIARVDMDVRAYDWQMPSGKSGRTAYLEAMSIEQNLDRFADRYGDELLE